MFQGRHSLSASLEASSCVRATVKTSRSGMLPALLTSFRGNTFTLRDRRCSSIRSGFQNDESVASDSALMKSDNQECDSLALMNGHPGREKLITHSRLGRAVLIRETSLGTLHANLQYVSSENLGFDIASKEIPARSETNNQDGDHDDHRHCRRLQEIAIRP